jgi:hypothetical protein
MQTTDGSPL